MKLKLKSNFWEPWHAQFDSEGIEFRLITTDGLNRVEMFHLFNRIGIPTPLFGIYGDFVKNNFDNDKKVVLYDDIRSHFGEDKRLCVFSELNSEDKLLYMSEYINYPVVALSQFIAKSTRYLFIGNSAVRYDYYSYNDWRSNNGRTYITEPAYLEVPKWRQDINYAMFALDFVGEAHELKAIDLNCSPGMPPSIHEFFSAQQMVSLIKEWYKKHIN